MPVCCISLVTGHLNEDESLKYAHNNLIGHHSVILNSALSIYSMYTIVDLNDFYNLLGTII